MRRMICLHYVLKTKWLCIILNILNKNRRKEMKHATENFDKLIEEKLKVVFTILKEKETFGIY
jgi:hypothetical protein